MNAPRLLIIDDAIALGGLERLWKALVPELAKHCETVTWMLPPHRIESFRPAVCNERNVVLESMVWSGWTGGRLRAFGSNRLIRMLDPIRPAWAAILRERAFRIRVNHVIRRHRSSHIIVPALFTQSFPKLPIPIFAGVADVNYHPFWKRECELNLARWAERCAGLITISEFSRTEVEKVCPGARGRVTCARLAAIPPPALRDIGDTKPEVGRLFYPASFNPHKQHALLLRALRALHQKGLKFQLQLTGGGLDALCSSAVLDIPELEEARRFLCDSPPEFRRAIAIRGYVSDDEIEKEYQRASCVVLPSSYEGFGLPLTEAVYRHRRVLCSDIPAFREQVQMYELDQCVDFVWESSVSAWAEALERSLAVPALDAQIVESRFNRWQWSDVAREVIGRIIDR